MLFIFAFSILPVFAHEPSFLIHKKNNSTECLADNDAKCDFTFFIKATEHLRNFFKIKFFEIEEYPISIKKMMNFIQRAISSIENFESYWLLGMNQSCFKNSIFLNKNNDVSDYIIKDFFKNENILCLINKALYENQDLSDRDINALKLFSKYYSFSYVIKKLISSAMENQIKSKEYRKKSRNLKAETSVEKIKKECMSEVAQILNSNFNLKIFFIKNLIVDLLRNFNEDIIFKKNF